MDPIAILQLPFIRMMYLFYMIAMTTLCREETSLYLGKRKKKCCKSVQHDHMPDCIPESVGDPKSASRAAANTTPTNYITEFLSLKMKKIGKSVPGIWTFPSSFFFFAPSFLSYSRRPFLPTMGYIPEEALPNLHKYKYGGVDKSLVSRYILSKYWNNLVKLFPLWIA